MDVEILQTQEQTLVPDRVKGCPEVHGDERCGTSSVEAIGDLGLNETEHVIGGMTSEKAELIVKRRVVFIEVAQSGKQHSLKDFGQAIEL